MIICSCFSFLSLSHLFCFNRKKTVLCYSLNQKNLVHHQWTLQTPLGQQIRYNITTYQFIQYIIKKSQQYIPEETQSIWVSIPQKSSRKWAIIISVKNVPEENNKSPDTLSKQGSDSCISCNSCSTKPDIAQRIHEIKDWNRMNIF